MLLLVDIGNTNIVVALHDGKIFQSITRFKTHNQDSLGLFNSYINTLSFDNAVVSSVVPQITDVLCALIKKPVLLISKKIKTGLDNSTIPDELGSDLLCNLIAARSFYPNDYVTVADFGTAFTTSTVSSDGKFMGATIAPGLWTAIKALFTNTAQIPSIEMQMPETVLGKDTVSSVRAGVIYGFKGQIEAVVSQIEKELNHSVKLVVTGGMSKYISEVVDRIDRADISWTLNGARIAFELNS